MSDILVYVAQAKREGRTCAALFDEVLATQLKQLNWKASAPYRSHTYYNNDMLVGSPRYT